MLIKERSPAPVSLSQTAPNSFFCLLGIGRKSCSVLSIRQEKPVETNPFSGQRSMEVNNQKECNCKVSSFWDILLPAGRLHYGRGQAQTPPPPHPHCFHLYLWSEPDLNHVWCRYHSKSISCLHSLQTTAQCSRQQITAVECQVQSVLLLQSWAWHGPRLSRDGHVWTHQPPLSLNMLASVNDPLFLCPPHPKNPQVSCTSFNSFHVLFFHALLKENT